MNRSIPTPEQHQQPKQQDQAIRDRMKNIPPREPVSFFDQSKPEESRENIAKAGQEGCSSDREEGIEVGYSTRSASCDNCEEGEEKDPHKPTSPAGDIVNILLVSSVAVEEIADQDIEIQASRDENDRTRNRKSDLSAIGR
jgi:hypothetical protein